MEGRLPQTAAGLPRAELHFMEVVRSRFSFLDGLGFTEVVAEPTYVRFERVDRFVAVFHGRASYELGVEFGRWLLINSEVVEQKFHISYVMSLFAPDEGYVARSATSRVQVSRFLEELAGWTKVAAERLEQGGEDAFVQLSEEVRRQSQEYLDDTRAALVRSRAEEAWHRRDFASVITAYEEIESEITTIELKESERMRLDYARKHADS